MTTRRLLCAAAALLILIPVSVLAQDTADTPAAPGLSELRSTVESQSKALEAMRAEMAEMRKAVIEASRAAQARAPEPEQVQEAYRAAVRAQAARCGRKGFRFVAVGIVDGKEAAFCLADMPKDLKP